MNEETAAKCLSELGRPTRLSVFRLLVRAGPGGMVVGAIDDLVTFLRAECRTGFDDAECADTPAA